jgi:hypothetical protein
MVAESWSPVAAVPLGGWVGVELICWSSISLRDCSSIKLQLWIKQQNSATTRIDTFSVTLQLENMFTDCVNYLVAQTDEQITIDNIHAKIIDWLYAIAGVAIFLGSGYLTLLVAISSMCLVRQLQASSGFFLKASALAGI